MSITHDFSNWAEAQYKYSIELITNEGILEFNETNKNICLSTQSKDIQKTLVHESLKAHLYWIAFGVGVECLAKAVLIKFQKMKITKRRILDEIPAERTSFNTYQELQEHRNSQRADTIGNVYKHVTSTNISSRNNDWLENQFQEKGIQHPMEINTPTLGKIYSSEIFKLRDDGIINENECQFLAKSLKLFTNMRRNVDAHVFLKSRVVGSINNDIERVYIPMINLLIAIYYREST